MKTVAIICTLSVLLCSCGTTTSNTSSRPYEINLPSQSEIRQQQTGATLITLAILIIVGLLITEHKMKQNIKNQKMTETMLRGINQALEAWKGQHITQFIRVAGPQNEIVSDGGTGKIYIWDYFTERVRRGIINQERTYTKKGFTERTEIMPPIHSQYKASMMIWTDSKGIVNHWKLKFRD